jgi:hypothetical protein
MPLWGHMLGGSSTLASVIRATGICQALPAQKSCRGLCNGHLHHFLARVVVLPFPPILRLSHYIPRTTRAGNRIMLTPVEILKDLITYVDFDKKSLFGASPSEVVPMAKATL